MRVTTAFNKMLEIGGATVTSVTFTPEGVVVGLRRRSRRLTCPCGWSTRACYDRSIRRWRHLDLGACRLLLESEIRRLHCLACDRVRTETVPWARPGARHTRDLEDMVAYLAQRVDRTTISRLLRVSWETVSGIVIRVVAEHLDPARLEGLYRIGVDEVSYRSHHRYLTIVADHDHDGAVVWAGDGKTASTLASFYEELGEEGCRRLQAVSLDLGAAYRSATTTHAPQATQCADPFHVVKLANTALDKTRSQETVRLRHHWQPPPKRPVGRPPIGTAPRPPDPGQAIRHTRWALLKDPQHLTETQHGTLERLRRQRSVLYRAWQLKETLRDLYRLPDPTQAPTHLDRWLAWASRSRIPAFVTLSRTIRKHRHEILAAIELELSNSKLEGIASKIRLINHRSYGHHTATALISMIYLSCGGITIQLPTQR